MLLLLLYGHRVQVWNCVLRSTCSSGSRYTWNVKKRAIKLVWKNPLVSQKNWANLRKKLQKYHIFWLKLKSTYGIFHPLIWGRILFDPWYVFHPFLHFSYTELLKNRSDPEKRNQSQLTFKTLCLVCNFFLSFKQKKPFTNVFNSLLTFVTEHDCV